MIEAVAGVEPGYCKCGCGKKTAVWRRNDVRHGGVKGESKAYIRGHGAHVARRRAVLAARQEALSSPDLPDCPPGAALLPLTRGKYAIVDEALLERLAAFPWNYNGRYAMRADRSAGRHKGIALHREIMGLVDAPKDVYCDHINGDKLDNRRANLRVCDNRQNQGNQKPRGGTSAYRGVYWHERRQVWCAGIKDHGRKIHLGSFATEKDAARAYDRAAVEIFGEFASLNFEGERL